MVPASWEHCEHSRRVFVLAGKLVEFFCCVSVLLAMVLRVLDPSLWNIPIIGASELAFGSVDKLKCIWLYGLPSAFVHMTSRFL